MRNTTKQHNKVKPKQNTNKAHQLTTTIETVHIGKDNREYAKIKETHLPKSHALFSKSDLSLSQAMSPPLDHLKTSQPHISLQPYFTHSSLSLSFFLAPLPSAEFEFSNCYNPSPFRAPCPQGEGNVPITAKSPPRWRPQRWYPPSESKPLQRLYCLICKLGGPKSPKLRLDLPLSIHWR